MSKTQASTLSFSKIDTSLFDVTKPEDNDRIPSQKLSYVRYKNKGRSSSLYMKTPRIQMTSGGIPKEGPYYDTELKRAKGFKIIFNQSNDDEKKFYDKMKELDKYFSSDDFRINTLGWTEKVSQTFDYVPIVRKPQEKDDDDEDETPVQNKKKYPSSTLEYMKAFFELEYQTNRPLVKIFHKQDNDEPKLVDDFCNLDDVRQKYMVFMGYYKYVLMPNKLYATKNKDQKTGRKTYGVTWKVICVEAEPPERLGGQVIADNPFISDDEDEDDMIVKETTVKITQMKLQDNYLDQNKELEQVVDEDVYQEEEQYVEEDVEQDVEQDNNVESEEMIKPKKKSSVKSSKSKPK